MIFTTKLNLGFVTAIFFTAMSLFTLSCINDSKVEDTKDVAEEYNEAKYDNTTKEKDAQFLVDAAEINLEEIQFSILAQQKSKTKMVIDLGKMMEENHNTAMNELITLASRKIVTIPTTATNETKQSYEKLEAKTGKEFDNAYCALMVDGHTNAITLFEKASTVSTDSDIKAWALATLTILRTHLDQAITCQKAIENNN